MRSADVWFIALAKYFRLMRFLANRTTMSHFRRHRDGLESFGAGDQH